MDKYTVNVNNKKYTVEFEHTHDLNSIKEVLLNGKKTKIDINMDTLCSIMVNNDTHKINGTYDFNGELVKILIGKEYHSVEVEEVKPIKINGNGINKKQSQENIMAPMPGKIISIDVNIGETIKQGQCLLALEAMKMENKIKATRDGVLKEIKTSVGSSCNSGDLLMVID